MYRYIAFQMYRPMWHQSDQSFKSTIWTGSISRMAKVSMVEGGMDQIKPFEGIPLEWWPAGGREGQVQPNETNSDQLNLIRARGGGGKGRGKGQPAIWSWPASANSLQGRVLTISLSLVASYWFLQFVSAQCCRPSLRLWTYVTCGSRCVYGVCMCAHVHSWYNGYGSRAHTKSAMHQMAKSRSSKQAAIQQAISNWWRIPWVAPMW